MLYHPIGRITSSPARNFESRRPCESPQGVGRLARSTRRGVAHFISTKASERGTRENRNEVYGRMRQFIRHPSDVPIEVNSASEFADGRGYNVGLGGVALRCPRRLEAGLIVELEI